MADRSASLVPPQAAVGAGKPDPIAIAERLTEEYLDIGDRSADEATVSQVQSLAAQAVARLAWLRSMIRGKPDPPSPVDA